MGDCLRVLHVISGMGSGGAESMIMNWYRNIDKTKIQFDFLIRSKENLYEKEIEALGGKVYYVSEFPQKYLSNFIQTWKFFKSHQGEYNIIHVHGNALLYTNIFLIAKHFGVKNRIMHSHSTSTKSKLFLPLHLINKSRIKRLANFYLACSDDAGKWCFNNRYDVIENGVNLEMLCYDEESRIQIRKELGIDKELALCHVGRFLPVKNHKFIFEMFEDLNKEYPDVHLILVGTGPLQQKYIDYVSDKPYFKNVHFLGVRQDVPKILFASDVFILPSVYEGVSIALIEAQASGLFCVASDNISKESKVTDNIEYLSIDNERTNLKKWINIIMDTHKINRLKANNKVKFSQYNIQNVVKKIEDIYLSME